MPLRLSAVKRSFFKLPRHKREHLKAALQVIEKVGFVNSAKLRAPTLHLKGCLLYFAERAREWGKVMQLL